MSEGNMRTSAVLRCIDSNLQITQENIGINHWGNQHEL